MIRIPYSTRSWFDEDFRESDPSFTLEKHIASLRDEDPERWAELQAEWGIEPPQILKERDRG